MPPRWPSAAFLAAFQQLRSRNTSILPFKSKKTLAKATVSMRFGLSLFLPALILPSVRCRSFAFSTCMLAQNMKPLKTLASPPASGDVLGSVVFLHGSGNKNAQQHVFDMFWRGISCRIRHQQLRPFYFGSISTGDSGPGLQQWLAGVGPFTFNKINVVFPTGWQLLLLLHSDLCTTHVCLWVHISRVWPTRIHFACAGDSSTKVSIA